MKKQFFSAELWARYRAWRKKGVEADPNVGFSVVLTDGGEIGLCIKVVNVSTGDVFDLTEYELW